MRDSRTCCRRAGGAREVDQAALASLRRRPGRRAGGAETFRAELDALRARSSRRGAARRDGGRARGRPRGARRAARRPRRRARGPRARPGRARVPARRARGRPDPPDPGGRRGRGRPARPRRRPGRRGRVPAPRPRAGRGRRGHAHAPDAQSDRVVADLDAAASALRERADNGMAVGSRRRRGLRPTPSGRAGRRRAAPAEADRPSRRGRTLRPTPAPRHPPRTLPAAASPERVRRAIVSAPKAPAREHATGRSSRQYPWLRGALVKLAHDDPQAAGRIIAGLLPVQSAIVQGPVDYDLTIAEIGTFAVTIAGGRAYVNALEAPRGRREAEFHLTADALTLAELIAGVPHKIGRFRGAARVSGRKRRVKPLRAIPAARHLARRGRSRRRPARARPRLPHLPLRHPRRVVARPLVHGRPADRRRPAGDLVHQRRQRPRDASSSPPRPRAARTPR